MKLTLRDWKTSDAVFVCYLRNDSRLNQWYRQEEKIALKEQIKFIRTTYGPKIIEKGRTPIGIFWIKDSGEVSLVMEEKDYKYIPQLFKKRPTNVYWGEVFVGNPILKWLLEAGFRTVGVKERAYYKKNYGLRDIIRCEF